LVVKNKIKPFIVHKSKIKHNVWREDKRFLSMVFHIFFSPIVAQRKKKLAMYLHENDNKSTNRVCVDDNN
jgi:hypothetical protein